LKTKFCALKKKLKHPNRSGVGYHFCRVGENLHLS